MDYSDDVKAAAGQFKGLAAFFVLVGKPRINVPFGQITGSRAREPVNNELNINTRRKNVAKIFISHSSKDKKFVRQLAGDLRDSGHEPWLDEWEIKVGECIAKKIEEGISDAEYVVIVLSKNSTDSEWFEREWKSVYWDEVNNRKTIILPVLLEDCNIPKLLQTKKYADFSKGYSPAFDSLLKAISPTIKSAPISLKPVESSSKCTTLRGG